MSIQESELSETDLLLYRCNFCECYINIAPIRIVNGKLACGRCDGNGTDIPLLEAVMKLVTLPCRFESLGCDQKVKWNDVQHELACKHNIRKCIVPACPWEAAHRELHAHIAEEHKQHMIIPRQNTTINFSSDSMHDLLYVDGNRIFGVSFSVDENGLDHSVSAPCAKPQLQFYKYDITITQNDIDITWNSQPLVIFEETTVKNNHISYGYLQRCFDVTERLNISICVYIDNIAPPPNAFYSIMDSVRCTTCSKKLFPYRIINDVKDGLYYTCCYKYFRYENELLEQMLVDLDHRPLSLREFIWCIKCFACNGIMSNEFSVRRNRWYCSKKCTQNVNMNVNTGCQTLFKNLLSLL